MDKQPSSMTLPRVFPGHRLTTRLATEIDSAATLPRWQAPYVGELSMTAHHRGEPGMSGCSLAEILTRELVEAL